MQAMGEDIIKIKGTKSGLLLTFAESAEFGDIEREILHRLQSGSSFFVKGTEILVPKGTLPQEQMDRLKKLFHQHGVLFRTEQRPGKVEPKEEKAPASASGKAEKAPEEDHQQMMVVHRTVRGGQEIRTKNSVLICGNVNPGAQIIAGGSIDIRGTCRGIVHAGAFGDVKAVVIADRLMPMQIRIANLIARSPDQADLTEPSEMVEKAERALVRDGQIVIEPIDR